MRRHEDLVWTPRTHIKSKHGYACLQPQPCGRWKWEAWGLPAVLQQGSAGSDFSTVLVFLDSHTKYKLDPRISTSLLMVP